MKPTQRATGIRKPQTAISVVIMYAKLVKGHAFSPEEVIAWAAEFGMVFEDQRHWGAHFRQTAKDGFIKPSVEQFRRKSSNGSMRPGWILA